MRLNPALAAVTLALCFALGFLHGAGAFVPLDGRFLAEESCPVAPAIRDIGRGSARLDAGESYDLLGKNRAEGTHFRIRLGSAQVWVPAGCGRLVGAGGDVVRPLPSREETRSVLAASWQPSFCETFRGRLPRECRALEEGRLPSAERSFTLHGLWPEPASDVWCGATDRQKRASEEGDWDRLPRPELTRETFERLARVMPGVASDLHRHQWIKHGGCYGAAGGPEEYFLDALWLMEQLNASTLAALFAESAGGRLEAGEIRAAADRAFGRGAGERIELRCDGRYIEELVIHLEGRIVAGETMLRDLIQAAPPGRGGCRGGIVDLAGD